MAVAPLAIASVAPSPAHFYYPNKMVRIVLLAMEEVLGRNGVNAVWRLAQLEAWAASYPPNNFDQQVSFSDFGQVLQALETLYGPHGGRTLALRAGRACFKHGLREFGPVLGVSDLTFRLLPLSMKLKVGFEALAQTFNQFSDQQVALSEDEQHFYWRNVRCPVCWGRHTESPCCHLAVGLLQESLYWVSGGKQFAVHETACLACGAEQCTISIEKKPLD